MDNNDKIQINIESLGKKIEVFSKLAEKSTELSRLFSLSIEGDTKLREIYVQVSDLKSQIEGHLDKEDDDLTADAITELTDAQERLINFVDERRKMIINLEALEGVINKHIQSLNNMMIEWNMSHLRNEQDA